MIMRLQAFYLAPSDIGIATKFSLCAVINICTYFSFWRTDTEHCNLEIGNELSVILLNISKLILSHGIILRAIENVIRIEHNDWNPWIEQEYGTLRELPIYNVKIVYQIHICMSFT